MNNYYRHHRRIVDTALKAGSRLLTGAYLAEQLQTARELVEVNRHSGSVEGLHYWARRLAHLEAVAAKQNG